MRTIETTATVSAEGTLTIKVPADIPPGEHRVLVVIREAPTTDRQASDASLPLRIMDWEAWPADSTFRREDLYGDDGR